MGQARLIERNVDDRVVKGFGEEWSRFDQSAMTETDYRDAFAAYFNIFPWERLSATAEGFDLGCGSGRWARGVAPRVGTLHCIDPSAAALRTAERLLADQSNVLFHCASVDSIPLGENSMDFGYCLGVLHHVPDTEAGLCQAVAKLKHGAPFLLYLYYDFDNKPGWYRSIWKVTEILRYVVSRSPFPVRHAVSEGLAATVYLPLARTALALERIGWSVESFPLANYRNRSFYVMRTDALDRFGTRLERRFSRVEIQAMMNRAGLREVRFSANPPYWCAVGFKG